MTRPEKDLGGREKTYARNEVWLSEAEAEEEEATAGG